MTPSAATVSTERPAGVHSLRDVTADQWKAFFAAYLGWVLDAFDFTIINFLLIDLQRTFSLNAAQTGAIGTITLLFRVLGGISSGTAADRWGRRLPLMFSILWYSLFAGLGGFAPSYVALLACRALFGIGMGGVWAAGMPLALEHWPARLRGIVSGMLQSGFSTGYILSAFLYSFVYPSANQNGNGWRVMMWIGILPALLVVWIVSNVKESPVWLERQRQLKSANAKDTLSLARLFGRDLRGITLQTALMMGAFLTFYYSITFWYATYLTRMKLSTLPYVVALNFGTMTGNMMWGRTSETRLGRRGAATVATVGGILAIPLYLYTQTPVPMVLGALAMGFFGAGNFGVIPTYLSERFPTAVRAAGAGFAYHVGVGIGSNAPYVVGWLQDSGMTLANGMAMCIAISGTLVVILLWLGPETRGRTFDT